MKNHAIIKGNENIEKKNIDIKYSFTVWRCIKTCEKKYETDIPVLEERNVCTKK